MYSEYLDFGEVWKACTELVTLDKTKWLDFIIQDGMLFKASELCISRSYMWENLIKEKYSGRLARHFGRDKTIARVIEKLLLATIEAKFKEFCTKL